MAWATVVAETTGRVCGCDRSGQHVLGHDFLSAITHDRRTLRLLVLIDEYTRECLPPHPSGRGSLRRDLTVLKSKGFIHTGTYCPDGYLRV